MAIERFSTSLELVAEINLFMKMVVDDAHAAMRESKPGWCRSNLGKARDAFEQFVLKHDLAEMKRIIFKSPFQADFGDLLDLPDNHMKKLVKNYEGKRNLWY